MSLTASTVVAYNAADYVRDQTTYDNPPLVHNHKYEPVEVIPINDGVQINDPNNIESELVLVANRYGEPEIVYDEYQLTNDSERHSIEPPQTDKLFAYTLYTEDGLYLGESNPLRQNQGSITEDHDKIPYNYQDSKHPYDRVCKRGYFEISFGIRDISFPISYQRYLQSERIVGYAGSYKAAKESKFLEQTGKRIVEQSNASTELEKMELLIHPVQEMNWERDMNSIGKTEYIRDPARTFVEMTGDCKDRTVINTGFIENVLDLDTCVMFVTGHMLTGVDLDSLSKSTVDNLDEDITVYDGKSRSYIAIDSTSQSDFGFEIPRELYALYRDSYQIYSLSGVVSHITYLIPGIGSRGAYN